jgi:hypothetical protein
MKNFLLITASIATLAAVGGLASAQGVNEHRERPAEATPEQKAPAGKSESVKPAPTAQAPEHKTDQKPNAPQKSESVKPAPTTAQAPEGKTDQKPNAPQKSESVKPAPIAQAPDKPTGAKGPSEHAAPNEAARAESKPDAPAALSIEHHARFRDSIRSEQVAPLNDVRFHVTVGEPVPRTVHLNRMPARILEYAPQYRGYEYILVGDEILIVDPRTLKIVAVIEA